MKLLLLLSYLIVVQAGVRRRNAPCDGPIVNGVHHTKDILKADIDRPYLLSTDYTSNTVYFSYSINAEDDVFKSAKMNLNTKEFTDIDGVRNGFAQSVDPNTHDVYIGGSEGVFVYKANSNKAEFYIANGTDIWMLFFKDVLYFSEYPSQFLYTVKDGEVIRFKDLEDTKVDNFVIDNDNNLFFTNYTGLYSQKKGTREAVYFENTADVGIRGLTTDINGNVYACVQDGIYKLIKDTHVLEKTLAVDNAFGVAFDDKNNIIYADATSLVRLKPSTDQECVELE